MDHLTEGQLQAYLDGEVEGAQAQSLAAHLETCGQCARAFAEMRAAAERVSLALGFIDRPAPTAAAFVAVVGANPDVSVRSIAAHRSWGRPARVGVLKAAMLALFATGAAAAAIPGSPVQRWLGTAWQRLTGAEAVATVETEATTPDVEPTPAEAPARPASISIEPVDGVIAVTLRDIGRAEALRVVFVDNDRATVEAEGGADARFRTGPSSIEAIGLGAGLVTVSLPRSLRELSVSVDGNVLLEKQDGTLRTAGTVLERTQDTIVFRTH
jgi:hypothetical protein